MTQFIREKWEASFPIHKSNTADEDWGSFNSESVKRKSSRESEGEEEQRRTSARRSEVLQRDGGRRGGWRVGEEEQG